MIDTKMDSIYIMFDGKIYEMTKFAPAVSGHVFNIDGKHIGMVDYHVSNKKILISMFSTKKFGNNSGKGYGTTFYNILIEYVKTKYGCTESYAKELTAEGNDFFKKMGLNNKNKNKDPDFRWDSI
jgi:hypothetical protein